MKQILIISLFITLSLLNIYGQDMLSIEKQDFLYKEDNNKIGLPKPKEKRIIFFGNSITQGWSSFTDYFKKNNYVNRGISGQTTPQMLLRYNDDVVNLKPYAVIILAGTNDLAGNTGPITIEEIFDNIKSMTKISTANNIKVFLCSILPVYDYLWNPEIFPSNDIIKLNIMIKKYCKSGIATYVDYHTSMKDERNGLKNEFTYWNEAHNEYDGVHPDKKGYLHMEKIIRKKLKKIL